MKVKMSNKEIIKNLINWFMDFVMPKDITIQQIEQMSADEFINRARPSPVIDSKWRKALFSYKDKMVRTAIFELKYRGNERIAKLFGEIIYNELTSETENKLFVKWTKPIIIPVPISNNRHRERGWNQCILIGREIEKNDNGIFFEWHEDFLEKIRETERQTKTSGKRARLENLRGSFAISNNDKVQAVLACQPKPPVIILDDVTTTGATLSEIRKILLRAGFKKIIGITVAH